MIEAFKVHISVACLYKMGRETIRVTPDHFLRQHKAEPGDPSPAPVLNHPPCDLPWFHLHLSFIFNVFLPPSTVSTAKWTMLLFGPTQPAVFYISFLHIPYLAVRAQPPFPGQCQFCLLTAIQQSEWSPMVGWFVCLLCFFFGGGMFLLSQ